VKFAYGIVTDCLPAFGAMEFIRDVRPILSAKRSSCHGPDATNRKRRCASKRPQVPRPDAGAILKRVTSTNKAKRRPPAYVDHDALDEKRVGGLQEWAPPALLIIRTGAVSILLNNLGGDHRS
jgi:hypothetical protein